METVPIIIPRDEHELAIILDAAAAYPEGAFDAAVDAITAHRALYYRTALEG